MNIEKSEIAILPTKYGTFKIRAYKIGNQEHLAIMSKNFEDLKIPYVRIHSESLTKDALGALNENSKSSLGFALKFISQNGGVVIYHRQEGKNIGLLNKVDSMVLQENGKSADEVNIELGFKKDQRDYSVVKEIFKDLKLTKIKLITENKEKIAFIRFLKVDIVEIIPYIAFSNNI